MEFEVFDLYPDYLKDFSQLEAMCSGQWSEIDLLRRRGEGIIAKGFLKRNYLLEWDDVLGMESASGEEKRQFFRRYSVVGLSELKSIIGCWFYNRKYDVLFDKATGTVTVRSSMSEHDTQVMRIRNAVPMNLNVQFEFDVDF